MSPNAVLESCPSAGRVGHWLTRGLPIGGIGTGQRHICIIGQAMRGRSRKAKRLDRRARRMAQLEALEPPIFCGMFSVVHAPQFPELVTRSSKSLTGFVVFFLFFVSDLNFARVTSHLAYCTAYSSFWILFRVLWPLPCKLFHTHERFAFCGAIILLYPIRDESCA